MAEQEHNDYHARLRVLEEWRLEARGQYQKLDAKIDVLVELMTKHQICPTPGACTELRKEGDALKKEVEKEVAQLQATYSGILARILKLEKWHVFLSGCAVMLGIVWTVFRVVLPYLSKLPS
jgi:septation ring formation regulator EzrA